MSVARLRQDPVEPFFQEGEHPPDIFILESKEPWEVAAQQDREQLRESQLWNWDHIQMETFHMAKDKNRKTPRVNKSSKLLCLES